MICIHAHVSCIFMDVSIASAASPAHTHPSIKGGGASRRPPFVDSFMDGCVWDGEAADAMETSINMHEACACMDITRNSCGYDIKIRCIYKYAHNSGPRSSPDMILSAFFLIFVV